MKAVNFYQCKYLWLVPAAMLIAALLPLPYGYYTLLRVIVTLAAAFLTYYLFQNSKKDKWVFAFGFIAILFNPLVPIYLSREVWAPIDIFAAGLFFLHYYLNKEKVEPLS